MPSKRIEVGDRVRLLGLPDGFIDDLPNDEQDEMRAFVGRCAVVTEIDAYGNCWIGLGTTIDANDAAHYSGHSFGVPPEFVEPA